MREAVGRAPAIVTRELGHGIDEREKTLQLYVTRSRVFSDKRV